MGQIFIWKFVKADDPGKVPDQVRALELEAVLLGPLFHDLDNVLRLRVGRVLQDLHNVTQGLALLLAGNDHLEVADRSPPLPFPVLGVGVQPLEHVEGLGRVEKLAHLQEHKQDNTKINPS